MRVQTCERCGIQGYASDLFPREVTLERVSDDGSEISTKDIVLCQACCQEAEARGLL